MSTTNLLTPVEASELLTLTTTQIRRLTKRGLIPFVRLPDDEIRFDEAELIKWVESCKERPQ